jgi:pyruvate dehydrogenase (quinone)
MMTECDTLFMIGTSFPYTEFLPKEGQARGVQIDIEPRNLSLRYPMDVALTGDSAETLRLLLPYLRPATDRGWRERVERWVRDTWRDAEDHAMAPAPPLNPQRVVRALSQQLPDGVTITGDSGSAAVWIARHVMLRRGMRASLSGGLATMGSAIPYAIAAKFATPDRVAIAITGDGAMQMSGLNALIDVAKHWRSWEDPRLIVLVLNNRDLNYVTWEQRAMEGDPKYERSQVLPDMPYARYAELLELRGARLETPDQIDETWRAALASDRPFVIDAVVSADVPTLPAILVPKQQHMLERALTTDPDASGVREQLAFQGVGVADM